MRGLVATRIRIVLFEKSTTRRFAELGLLYGIHARAGSTLFAARAGIGAVWYEREDTDATTSRDFRTGFGAPWEVGATQVFGGNFGLGVKLAGNANAFHHNIGGLLVLHLGKVW